MSAVTATTARAYESERRRLIRQRAVAASVLGLVFVPLFGIVDYFMYRPYFAVLMGTRALSGLVSGLILMLLYSRFGRRHPSELAVVLLLQVGLTIGGIPVYVSGADTA